MKCLVKGHVYEVAHLDGDGSQIIQFVDRDHGRDCEGTFNQEILRVLIDRVRFLDAEKPWSLNDEILHHLRMALVLHEARALCRKTEKGAIKPETFAVGRDGHFICEG